MSKVRFIGDIHGKNYQYLDILQDCPYPSIQVGDYGVGFVSNPIPFSDHKKHRFIRGNHDDPELCRAQANWIEDGTIENNIVFIGGAGSIDRMWRTEGIDWWRDEQLTVAELNKILDTIITVQPEIIVSHECPDFVADDIVRQNNWRKFEDDNRTRMMLQEIYWHYTPKLHIFGHWHVDYDKEIQGTRFICLNELSYVDIDTDMCDEMEG